jgi:hypothetical protein
VSDPTDVSGRGASRASRASWSAALERRWSTYLQGQLDSAKTGPEAGLIVDDPFNVELARQTLRPRPRRATRTMFDRRARQPARDLGEEVFNAVGDELKSQGISDAVSAPSLTTLQMQAGSAIDEMATMKGEQGALLREVVVQSLRTNVTPTRRDTTRSQGALGRTAAQLTSLIDTTVMGIDRTADVQQGVEAGVDAVPLRRAGRQAHAAVLHAARVGQA